MANSDLYDKRTYRVPDHVIEVVKSSLQQFSTHDGSQSAKNLLRNREISYSLIKKLKHFFDTQDKDVDIDSDPKYLLHGGKKMSDWVNSILNTTRGNVVRKKSVLANSGLENQFRRTHEKTFTRASTFSVSDMKMPKVKKIELYEEDSRVQKSQAALGVVLNPEGRILLLKRQDGDAWMPGRWALIGGGVEDNEEFEEALVREIEEESKLSVDKVKYCFSTNENDTTVHVFIARCTNPDEIDIKESEHSQHAWVLFHELENYETVPNLKAYIYEAVLKLKQKSED